MRLSLLRKLVRTLLNIPRDLINLYLVIKVKNSRSKSHKAYIEHPKVTAILQFFNKRKNIKQIMAGLRVSGIEEIIVIDDGSADGSYSTWMQHLTGPNEFLLRCNDIYEVRTYNRAIRMARGEFVCLLQDDDLLPDGDVWVKQALQLFDRFSDLLILGGRNGADLLIPDPPGNDGNDEYKIIGNVGGCPSLNKYVLHHSPPHLEPSTGIPFMFTMSVNRAPTFLRRTEFINLGGIDQRFAPFQCDDIDVCIRTWLAGYKVGLYECQFKRNVIIGGMRLFQADDDKEKQIRKNWALIYELYGNHIASHSLQNLVDKANKELLNYQYTK